MKNRVPEHSVNGLYPDIMDIIKLIKLGKGERNLSYSKYINCFICNSLKMSFKADDPRSRV